MIWHLSVGGCNYPVCAEILDKNNKLTATRSKVTCKNCLNVHIFNVKVKDKND